MEERFGDMGSGRAWTLGDETGPEPLARNQKLSVDEFEDSDSEYSDGDEVAEVVGANWWQDVAIPNMWRLVEEYIVAHGIDGTPYDPQKRMWADPVVKIFGMNNLDPKERVYFLDHE